MKNMSLSDPATKHDISRLEALLHQAFQMIFERFDIQDIEIAKLTASHVRMENILNATVNQVDSHEGRITKLEIQPV